MRRTFLLFSALLLAAAAPPPASVGGVWDLRWKNSRGVTRSAWLLLRQHGQRIDAELHGRHEVTTSGSIAGDRFELRGSRFFIPYRIVARVDGERIEGAVSAPHFERHFVGTRRRG